MNPWAPAGLHAEPNFAYRLTAHARSRWFALRNVHVHLRRYFAYLDGRTVLLLQQSYGGSAHRWGFSIYAGDRQLPARGRRESCLFRRRHTRAVPRRRNRRDVRRPRRARHPDLPACLQDCDWEAIEQGHLRLVRQSIAVTTQPVSAAAWQDILSTYLVCAQDNGTPPTVQRDQARRAGRAAEISAGHHPFLSQPRTVADVVLDLMPSS